MAVNRAITEGMIESFQNIRKFCAKERERREAEKLAGESKEDADTEFRYPQCEVSYHVRVQRYYDVPKVHSHFVLTWPVLGDAGRFFGSVFFVGLPGDVGTTYFVVGNFRARGHAPNISIRSYMFVFSNIPLGE